MSKIAGNPNTYLHELHAAKTSRDESSGGNIIPENTATKFPTALAQLYTGERVENKCGGTYSSTNLGTATL